MGEQEIQERLLKNNKKKLKEQAIMEMLAEL